MPAGRLCINPIVSGQRYSRLLVIEKTDKRIHHYIVYKCLCDCGKEVFINGNSLRTGLTRSCGCIRHERRVAWGKTQVAHGHDRKGKRSREYITWDGMKSRTTNSKLKDYPNYGGRGIKVCAEWFHSFENFLAYLKASGMYPKPAGLSIDRIENNGNYEPGNIRWADKRLQNSNRRNCNNNP
jgi:hypothetical protein